MHLHLPGLHLQDLRLQVPLDHAVPGSQSIEIYARVVTAQDGEQRPYLLYLQGGPGSEGPRPAALNDLPAWQQRLLRDYRLVLLDQRGTGLSTPVGRLEGSAEEQADYLSHFRADAIVHDAEAVHRALGAERWSVLGQSFGGFCTLTYLSLFPEAVETALFTGGLPAPGHHIDEVYARTWETLRRKSEAYYRRFPEDRPRVARLMDLAGAGTLRSEREEEITPEMLRRLGMHLGSDGGAERLHFFLEHQPSSPLFRAGVRAMLPFHASNPLYLVLHEACWADDQVTNWAAERTMPAEFAADPTLLAGEHVHRDFLRCDPLLHPYREVAELLAARHWGPLYDRERLQEVPVSAAAAIYVDDAFVPFEFSRETAGLLPGLRTYITDEYEHSGIRASGERVIDRLLGLAGGQL
ncbi:alpha/beta hydrolase [Deinococcus sp. Marseille-Q6407]|uniref:alpha/beta hydrolase n=1 Tax=Deinococcus sp. Marseille-Q6407 TaxID=2969223 RepID=UPI0021BE536F|nr:alpha/beta hydrolase [Deinococcus sp. Marseille-Q6407]